MIDDYEQWRETFNRSASEHGVFLQGVPKKNSKKTLITYHLDGSTSTDITDLTVEEFVDMKRNISMNGDFHVIYVKEI